jgi:hypothetical protein
MGVAIEPRRQVAQVRKMSQNCMIRDDGVD